MKTFALFVLTILFFSLQASAQEPFTLEEILRAPLPENLIAAKKVNRLAWTFYQEGKRNIWVAEGPAFVARRLTSYFEDDGQQITSLSFSEDGNTIIYVRGGDSNLAGEHPNPTNNPAGVEQAIWTIPWVGGIPQKVDSGYSPKVSVDGLIAYIRDGQLWIARMDGSEKSRQIIVRGQNKPMEWSPDGERMAFVSSRGDHSFIGVYDVNVKSVSFISPSVDTDGDPVWSVDGKRIAFVRHPAKPHDWPQGFFIEPDRPHPWAIWVADAATLNAREVWHSSLSPQGSFPYVADDGGGGAINWASGDRVVMASEEDGWEHLYSLAMDGSPPQLLTPGNCEVEEWSFSPDRQTVLFTSNCGDEDRRHLWKVAVSTRPAKMLPVTIGQGIESSPVFLSDGVIISHLGSDALHPARVFVMPSGVSGTEPQILAPETWPINFPSDVLVVPQQVIFLSEDGVKIHGQLFMPHPIKSNEKVSALVFMHGGPRFQTYLGWHHRRYFSNTYALNQYLVSRGYMVLSVNYRSGTGYGRAFREAPGRAGRGATEYRDIVAAGKYLLSRSDVDPARIGLWGGSYGGYLTAMGLGRNSDIFAAGVDFHGVHDRLIENWDGKNITPELTEIAHESSPVAAVNTWKSPVLFIHGDDDRNVSFTQTVDLVARLRARGVDVEQLVFPDEIHAFLLHRNWLAAYHATSDFLDYHLKERTSRGGRLSQEKSRQ
jgi:dipeptidyl aminopeptidase/acylaminoacyl peptidase